MSVGASWERHGAPGAVSLRDLVGVVCGDRGHGVSCRGRVSGGVASVKGFQLAVQRKKAMLEVLWNWLEKILAPTRICWAGRVWFLRGVGETDTA